MKLDIRNLTP